MKWGERGKKWGENERNEGDKISEGKRKKQEKRGQSMV